jgi:hypothetical protein
LQGCASHRTEATTDVGTSIASLMTIIDVPFEPFVRRGENYVSYWDVSAAHTHYVGERGNTELKRSLKLACRRGKGLGMRFTVRNSRRGCVRVKFSNIV